MENDQYQVLLRSIQGLRDDIARIDRDLAQDRKDLNSFIVRLGALEDQVDNLQRVSATMQNKVKDRVEEVVQPIVEETQKLTEEIKKKRFIAIKTKTWLDKLLRR